jgi:hypothetical protein
VPALTGRPSVPLCRFALKAFDLEDI